MAKKPASPKATPKSVGKVAPPDLVGADVGGESPQKASPVPEDAEISFSYTEPQADGGETHQVADDPIATLTTQQGIPVADDQNSFTTGASGTALLEGFHLRTQIFHFENPRLTEAVVNERG